MKKVYIMVSILSVFSISAKPVEPYPQTEISNGLIRARIYLPDAKEGYYRGSRFDWSGVMPELEYQGHTYFGQWFDKHSPTLHDAIVGPVDDFLPVGYDEAKVGEGFLKIGIGVVSKPDEPKYSIVTPYKIINGGSWAVKKKSDNVQFIHSLEDKQFAYEYKKTVQLVKGKPEMVLSYTFKNTGTRTIETHVYNHNFFVMDNQPVGRDYFIKFPFPLSASGQGKGDIGKISDNQIIFLKDLQKSEHLYYPSLTGFGNSAKDYDIRVENYKTGAAVRITSDRPLSKLVFWSAHKTVCPEPYTRIKVNPGEKYSWKIFYEFYSIKNNN